MQEYGLFLLEAEENLHNFGVIRKNNIINGNNNPLKLLDNIGTNNTITTKGLHHYQLAIDERGDRVRKNLKRRKQAV